MNEIRILLVEDSEIARKIAKLTLIEMGCTLDVAEDGQKALEMFKKNEYDMILMDIGLPDISGIDVTREIRQIENGTSHIPIIALSANFDESYKPYCLQSGMDDFLLKPLTKEKGQKMLNQFLKR